MSNSDQAEKYLLSANAMTALDLKKQPFDHQTRDFSLFSDDAIQDLIKQIEVSLTKSDQLTIISGAAGAGKSCLLSLLVASATDRVQYFIVEGHSQFVADNVFAGILEAFQIPAPDDLQSCLDQLAEQLRTLEDQTLQAVVLLDDAQDAAPAELYKLISGMLYMRGDSELRSFRILLTSTPQFAENIAQLIPADREIHYTTLSLPKLDIDTTEDFIQHHLYHAGYFEPLPLSNGQLQEIRRSANGLPGPTCMEASKLLNETYQTPEPISDEIELNSKPGGFFGKHLVLGAIALGLLLISTYLFVTNRNAAQTQEAETANVVITSEPLDISNNSGQNDSTPPKLILLSELNSRNRPTKARPSNGLENRPSPPPVPYEEVSAAEVSDKPQTDGSNTSTPPKIEKITKVTELSPPPAPPPPAKKVEEKPVKKQTAEKNKTAETESAEEKPAQPPVSAKKAETNTEPAITTQAPKKPDSDNNTKDEKGLLQSPNWVLMQNPEQFTVQMIASSNREEVERFLNVHQLPGPNSIFSFKRADETWYALVHGLYTDIEDAQQAIRSLPEKVRTNHPWIRQIKRIHQSLKAKS